MRQFRLAALFFAFFVLNSTLLRADQFWLRDLNQARQKAQELNRPILCHFGAKWCAPCQKMEKYVLNQPDVLKQLQASVVGVKIDVNERSDLARRFGVERFPTDVFLEPDGRQLLVTTGEHTAAEYLQIANRAGTRFSDLLAARNPRPRPPVTASPAKPGNQTQLATQAAPVVMLDGYCPVTLWKNRRWEKGSPQFEVLHDGQSFRLASAELKREFQQQPERFAPRFLGCDPVVVWETDKAVPGSTRWAAFYDDELFLFVSAENRGQFKREPDKFIRTRVVLHLDQIESVVR